MPAVLQEPLIHRFVGYTSPISKSYFAIMINGPPSRHASHFTIARSCAVTLSIIVQYAYVNRTVTMKDRVQIVARDSPRSTSLDLKEASQSHDSAPFDQRDRNSSSRNVPRHFLLVSLSLSRSQTAVGSDRIGCIRYRTGT